MSEKYCPKWAESLTWISAEIRYRGFSLVGFAQKVLLLVRVSERLIIAQQFTAGIRRI
jgi:hypothetical protein